MLVIFSHGKESGPHGIKIQLLSATTKELGFETHSIDYTSCKDVSERVQLLEDFIKKNTTNELILVGSSMGGYVATVVAEKFKTKGLFLMCPALYLTSYPIQVYRPITNNIEIVHGWEDKIVPYQNSIRFGQKMEAHLHLVKDNHRLSEQRAFLVNTFKHFLMRLLTN